MGQFGAGQGFGARDDDDDDGGLGWGSPLVILLGSLAAAIVVGLVLMLIIKQSVEDGGDGTPATHGSSLAERDGRVILSVKIDGDGSGSLDIAPLDVTCRELCSQAFATGTRVVITADAAARSRFTGWGGACTGHATCTIRMADDTTVTATFDRKLTSGDDEPLDTSPVQGDGHGLGDGSLSPDCMDGRDNDGDGLTDVAQDPDCDNGSESHKPATTPPPPPPPPPPAAPRPAATPPPAATSQQPTAEALPADDCSDGRDNDGDGLTDSAQDPNCLAGQTEAGGSLTG